MKRDPAGLARLRELACLPDEDLQVVLAGGGRRHTRQPHTGGDTGHVRVDPHGADEFLSHVVPHVGEAAGREVEAVCPEGEVDRDIERQTGREVNRRPDRHAVVGLGRDKRLAEVRCDGGCETHGVVDRGILVGAVVVDHGVVHRGRAPHRERDLVAGDALAVDGGLRVEDAHGVLVVAVDHDRLRSEGHGGRVIGPHARGVGDGDVRARGAIVGVRDRDVPVHGRAGEGADDLYVHQIARGVGARPGRGNAISASLPGFTVTAVFAAGAPISTWLMSP